MGRSRPRLLRSETDPDGRIWHWWSTHRLIGYGETQEAARADYALVLERLRSTGLEVVGAIGEPALRPAEMAGHPGMPAAVRGWTYGPSGMVMLCEPAKKRR